MLKIWGACLPMPTPSYAYAASIVLTLRLPQVTSTKGVPLHFFGMVNHVILSENHVCRNLTWTCKSSLLKIIHSGQQLWSWTVQSIYYRVFNAYLTTFYPFLTPHNFRASTDLQTRAHDRTWLQKQRLFRASTCYNQMRFKIALDLTTRFPKHSRNRTKLSTSTAKLSKQTLL